MVAGDKPFQQQFWDVIVCTNIPVVHIEALFRFDAQMNCNRHMG
jgi:hypothetical protein